LDMVVEGKIDPSFVISHRLPLEDAAEGYKLFKNHQDEVTKVVLRPS
jgi:threonine dehydrogenase-like Zn-dependent dehydrogenase